MTQPAYDELVRHWSRLHRFAHLHSIASWDRAAMMPPKGNEARALALAEMDGLVHRLRTEPRLAGLLAAGAMVLLRVLTMQEAYRAISWTTVILVGAMFPISQAMQVSGAANELAELLVDVAALISGSEARAA